MKSCSRVRSGSAKEAGMYIGVLLASGSDGLSPSGVRQVVLADGSYKGHSDRIPYPTAIPSKVPTPARTLGHRQAEQGVGCRADRITASVLDAPSDIIPE